MLEKFFGKKSAGSDVKSVCNAFVAQIEKEGLKYTKNAEDNRVMLNYSGDHFKSKTFVFSFDKDGKSFSLHVFSLVKFSDDQLDAAYKFCNTMNNKYRWLKTYVDSDKELTVEYDGVIDASTAGPVCSEILHRSVSITDDIMGALQA